MRGPIELLKESWSFFQTHWKLLLGIFLIPGLITAVIDYLNNDTYGQSGPANMLFQTQPILGVIVAAVFLAILLLMNIAMYKAIVSPSDTTIKSAYEYALKNFVPYLVVSIIMGVVIILGFAALIIPGIIFAIWFSFSYFALLNEGKKGVDALKASREYVKGNWWPVFGRVAVLCVAMILLSIVTGIAGMILSGVLPTPLAVALTSFVTSGVGMPFAIIYSYFLYQDLKKLKGGVASTPAPATPVESM